MKTLNCCFVLITLVFFLRGCAGEARTIERISIDFPHGETRLLVWRDGSAFLFFGALPRHQEIRKGIFDVEVLYEQLRARLHENAPREQWPDPEARAGMVQINFTDQPEEIYLLFDEAASFVEGLLDKARENVVGQRP